jgi:hypothetical protein
VLAEWVPDALAAEAVVPAAVVPAAVAPEAVVPAAVVPEAVVSEGLAVDGRAVVLDGGAVEAAAVGRGMWSPGAVVGLNVATDSITPATRHTARMLASSGMAVPRPAMGPASRRIRSRRRFARSSRR